MYKSGLCVLLFVCLAGQLAWTADTKSNTVAINPPESHNISTTTAAPTPTNATDPPSTTTPKIPTSSQTPPTSPPKPDPTPKPSPSPPSPSPPTPSPPSPSPPTPSPPTPSPPKPSPPTPKPVPPPSDRKFDAFSFIGGFALAIGLTAIGFLAWKLYISRRESVYHTL